MSVIRVASLFSGIGGFEHGLTIAKIKYNVVFASEIDSRAVNTYGANFSLENMNGDITKIPEREIPNHDLLCAGFPCQSFSIAGMRKGFSDIRGTLFFDVVRIIKEKHPKYIFLENVKNIVSHDEGNTIKTIIKNISDCGYTFDFTVINSKEAGVPQSRDRFYLIGIYGHEQEPFLRDNRNETVSRIKEWSNSQMLSSFNFFNNLKFNQKNECIVDIIDEGTIAEKYYIRSNELDSYLQSINLNVPTKREDRIIKLLDLPRSVHNDLERQRRVYSIYGISPTLLARSDTTKILVGNQNEYRIRKVTPYEAFKIQGFNSQYVANIKKLNIADGSLYKQAGNAVSPPVIAGIVRYLMEYTSENI